MVIQTALPFTPSPHVAPVTVIELREALLHWRRHWRLGSGLGAVTALLIFCTLGLGEPMYEGTAKIEYRIQERSLLAIYENGGGLTENSALQISNNHRTAITSRSFWDYLYKKLPPERRAQLPLGEGAPSLLARLGLKAMPAPSTVEDRFAQLMQNDSRAEPVKDSHMMQVSYRSGDRELAAWMTNQVATHYVSYLRDRAVEDAKAASSRIDTKVEEARQKLHQAEEALAGFSAKADLLLKSANDTVPDTQMMEAAKLAEARAESAIRLSRSRDLLSSLQHVSSGDITAAPGFKEDAQINELTRQQATEEGRLAAMLESCGQRHPKVVSARNTILQLAERLQQRVAAIIRATEGEVTRLSAEHTHLGELLTQARTAVFSQGSQVSQQKLLTSEVEHMRKLMADLAQQRDRAYYLAELGGVSPISVADLSATPLYPVGPNKLFALMAAMSCGMCLAIMLPVGWGWGWANVQPLLRGEAAAPPSIIHALPSTTSRTRELVPEPMEPATSHPMPLLCMLPQVNTARGGSPLRELLSSSREGRRDLDRALSTLVAQRGSPALGVILVTSMNAGDGKSLFAASLAAEMSTRSQPTLLIECNNGSPGAGTYFPITARPEPRQPSIAALRHGTSPLHILRAEQQPAASLSELLLGYQRWIEAASVAGLRWVVIDAVSITSDFADLRSLITLATGVVLVQDFRAGTTVASTPASLLSQICPASSLSGVVINRHPVTLPL